MTTECKREIAKFACGAELFHVFVYALFVISGTTIRDYVVLSCRVAPENTRNAERKKRQTSARAITISGQPD